MNIANLLLAAISETSVPIISYLVRENFEGGAAGWTFNTAGGGSINPSSTARAANGTRSMRMTGTSATPIFASKTFAPQAELDAFFAFYRGGTGNTVTEVVLANLQTEAESGLSARYDTVNNRIGLRDGTTLNWSANGVFGINQWHYIWLHYRKGTGADTLHELFLSSTPIKPETPLVTITTGANMTEPDRILLLSRSTVQPLDFDWVRVLPTTIGSNPP